MFAEKALSQRDLDLRVGFSRIVPAGFRGARCLKGPFKLPGVFSGSRKIQETH